MGYRVVNETVYSAKYHIIWCPMYRRGVLVGPVEDRLKGYLVEVAGRYVGNQKRVA